ncbi:hypothetical protein [Rickettsiales endosymbiont of Trichoplax sp. H2]|uniref:hypothetical protein n=1 Tax=Rickettsiales endosymbiont of Trichoplax sp. H2 TaxID=2021221 RepID=UPI0018A80E69|nr:hypothetical protein [Rickettsiales endosymbiont of Trichoplax sp. H2]MSO14572.1 hypothetical protein [Rickettsiales endosymbiont of Trichoplax sp. H2]
MKTEHFTNFDTLAAVKQLHAAGLEDRIAEAIVNSISISRKTDLSNLVSKDDFFDFKEEVKERFDTVNKEIISIKHDIHDLKKDTKSEMELLRKDIIAQMAINKNSITQWLIGLFMVLMIAIFIKPHF